MYGSSGDPDVGENTANRENALWQRLCAFRDTHPLKELTVGGVGWSYIECGQGKQVLLMLPGALGEPDLGFQLIAALEAEYRVFAPRYAAVDTLAACVDGVAGILEAEHVTRAHVLGGSFGGMIAQAFARRHPDKVDKLILSHTAAPDPDRARKADKLVRVFSALPMWFLRWALRQKFRRALPAGVDAATRRFFSKYLNEILALWPKQDFLGRMTIAMEFARQRFPQPHAADAASVLILEADDDRMVRTRDREALKQAYPQAQVHTFRGTGHAASLVKTDEFISVIKEFLRRP